MATRWGCVGLGQIASDFFTAILEHLSKEEHEFAAVASRDVTRSKAFAEKFKFKRVHGSYQELATDPDIDIVYIATLSPSHNELNRMMLEGGKHVLCEKPMGLNSRQVKQTITLAKKKKLFFMEGIWSRFFPVYGQIRKELDGRTLGTVRLVQASMCKPNFSKPRSTQKELGGGCLIDMGIYTIQLACLVFDEMPEKIIAEGILNANGVDEGVCVILKYRGGGMCSLTCHLNAGDGFNNATIQGDRGKILVGANFWCPTKVTTPSGEYEFPLGAGSYNYGHSAGFQYEAQVVRRCLQRGDLECNLMPHRHSEMIFAIMDEVRRQVGVTYPPDED